MRKGIMFLIAMFLTTTALIAVPPTIENEAAYFVDPANWDANSLYTTYQEWDVFSPTPNPPNETGFYATNPAGLISPSLLPISPGFFSSSGFYAFSGNYSFKADIYNHGGTSGGGVPAGYGTHVIFQVAASQNPDGTLQDPNIPIGIFHDTIRIVDLSDQPITGGSNAEALRIDRISNIVVPTGNPIPDAGDEVFSEEIIAEFFLSNYVGDFRIIADAFIHCNTKQVQVDTLCAAGPVSLTPIPGPRDINDNNVVDFVDFSLLIGNWLNEGCEGYEGCNGSDFNLDGIVDLNDVHEFFYYWLEGV